MTDYTSARINMVDSQIHTMGVIDQNILNAFRTLEREKFVPAGKESIAYTDEDLSLGGGRFLTEPLILARLLQAALPVAGESVLDIGGATGYSAALLAMLGTNVTVLENDDSLLRMAKDAWVGCGFESIVGVTDLRTAPESSFDVIIVNGAVVSIPQDWKDRLKPGGRLACVVKPAHGKVGQAHLIVKNASGVVGERVLFDAGTPYLPGYEPRKQFVF